MSEKWPQTEDHTITVMYKDEVHKRIVLDTVLGDGLVALTALADELSEEEVRNAPLSPVAKKFLSALKDYSSVVISEMNLPDGEDHEGDVDQ